MLGLDLGLHTRGTTASAGVIFEGETADSSLGLLIDSTGDHLPTGWIASVLADGDDSISVTAATQVVDGVECIELTASVAIGLHLTILITTPAIAGTWKASAYLKASEEVFNPYLSLSDDIDPNEVAHDDSAIATSGPLSSALHSVEAALHEGATEVTAGIDIDFAPGTPSILLTAKLERVS